MSSERARHLETTADRSARAALSAVTEPGDVAVAVRVRNAGPEATWHAVLGGDDTLDPTHLLRRRAEHVDGAEGLEQAQRGGFRYLCPGGPRRPRRAGPAAARTLAVRRRRPRGTVGVRGRRRRIAELLAVRRAGRVG